MAIVISDVSYSALNPMKDYFKERKMSLAYRILFEKEQKDIDAYFQGKILKPMAGFFGYDTRRIQKGINVFNRIRKNLCQQSKNSNKL